MRALSSLALSASSCSSFFCPSSPQLGKYFRGQESLDSGLGRVEGTLLLSCPADHGRPRPSAHLRPGASWPSHDPCFPRPLGPPAAAARAARWAAGPTGRSWSVLGAEALQASKQAGGCGSGVESWSRRPVEPAAAAAKRRPAPAIGAGGSRRALAPALGLHTRLICRLTGPGACRSEGGGATSQ